MNEAYLKRGYDSAIKILRECGESAVVTQITDYVDALEKKTTKEAGPSTFVINPQVEDSVRLDHILNDSDQGIMLDDGTTIKSREDIDDHQSR